MKLHVFLSAILLTTIAARGAETPAVNLLDTDLTTHWTTTGNWSWKDGVATLTPREGEKGWTRWGSYLWSKKDYGDFEIEFDYQVQKGGNSGFYFRVGDVNDPVAKGIEVQISDTAGAGPEKKLNDHDSGGIIPGVPPTKRAAKPAGEWNHFHIVNQGDKLMVKLNDQVVNEVNLADPKLATRPKVGKIGFQDHGLPLAIRNIKIRDLGSK
jgi:hypothetical protein